MENTKEIEKKKETKKETKTSQKAKHKAKASIGDIIFRALVLIIIFFIVAIMYIFYVHQMTQKENIKTVDDTSISSPIKEKR